MARYVSTDSKTKAYAPRKGKLVDLKTKKMAPPALAGDELYLRLGIPDHLMTGPKLKVVPHNPDPYDPLPPVFVPKPTRPMRSGKTGRPLPGE